MCHHGATHVFFITVGDEMQPMWSRKDGGHAAARGNEAKREKDIGQLGPMGARRAPKLRAEPPAHPPPPHLLSKKTKGGASSGPPQIVPPRMRLVKAVLRCAALSVYIVAIEGGVR